jgi:hypothetical protein
MEKVIRERRELRTQAINRARMFVDCVSNRLELSRAIVVGSYARGDFNRWSDIDVILVIHGVIDRNPLRRLDVITECMRIFPDIEPIILTEDEYKALLDKKNPLVVDAERDGLRIL